MGGGTANICEPLPVCVFTLAGRVSTLAREHSFPTAQVNIWFPADAFLCSEMKVAVSWTFSIYKHIHEAKLRNGKILTGHILLLCDDL